MCIRDRYYGRAQKVLARIEAGAQREGDELELRERCLELFKVVSKDGAPVSEITLVETRIPSRSSGSRRQTLGAAAVAEAGPRRVVACGDWGSWRAARGSGQRHESVAGGS
jgi:hypothetical protein